MLALLQVTEFILVTSHAERRAGWLQPYLKPDREFQVLAVEENIFERERNNSTSGHVTKID